MSYIIETKKELKYDTVVIGGGVAGCAAAAAARGGARTLLVEELGVLGGQAAGSAAALAVRKDTSVSHLDGAAVHNKLITDGVKL